MNAYHLYVYVGDTEIKIQVSKVDFQKAIEQLKQKHKVNCEIESDEGYCISSYSYHDENTRPVYIGFSLEKVA